ncbi:hypothetical protein E4U45_000516 [Claviceps purpurea]|nr:hypothetical protein E4U45_000516 [Claviceps purpurea]
MVLDTMTMDLTNRLLRRHPDHKVSDNSGSLEIDSSNSYFLDPLGGQRGRGTYSSIATSSQDIEAAFRSEGLRAGDDALDAVDDASSGREFEHAETAMEHSQDLEVTNYGDVSNYVHAGHVEDEQPSSIFDPTEI